MTINLYTQTKPYNAIVRNMTGETTVTGYLRGACNVFKPQIEIEYDATLLGKNYAYIPEYGRYYYYEESPTIDGKTMILHLKGDSMYNFKTTVYNTSVIAERSSSNYDLMLPDSAVLGEQGYTIFNRVLPYQFTPNNGQYILTIAGGS